jgi:hypothetical protein
MPMPASEQGGQMMNAILGDFGLDRPVHPGNRALRNQTAISMLEQAAPEDLRVVILECPLDSWQDQDVRTLFSDLVDLKMRGFGAQYSAKVLPVDTTDFIGRHFLSCLETPRGLRPIAGFRAVDLERCQSFNQPFPAESLARAAKAPRHAEAVRRYVEHGRPVSYIGSWTVHPAVRCNPRLRAALREHFALGGVLLHHEVGMHRIILGATLRFKVDRLLAPVGYRALAHDGEPLPPIAAPHLHGELVRLMHLDRCCGDALERARALRGAWNARMVF